MGGLVDIPLSRLSVARAGATATRFNSAGVLETVAANTARIDYDPVTLACRGLLEEETRTNAVRNPRCEGASAGTPGALPTYWGASSLPSGVTRTIVGTGTEDGIPYIDIRWQGTGSGYFDTTMDSVAATTGQTATASAYCRLIAGSWANFSSANIILYETPSFSQSAGVSLLGVTGAALRTQRPTATRTMTIATTTAGAMRLALTAAGAVDATLRFGLPQLELGAWASSPILPPVGAPGISTRNADVVTVATADIPGWNAQAGSICVEATTFDTRASAAPVLVHLDDGTTTSRMMATFGDGSSTLNHARFLVDAGGVSQASIGATLASALASNRIAVAWALNSFAVVANGGAVSTDTSGAVPTVNTLRIGGRAIGPPLSLNGYIRRLTFYPRRLSNAELQALAASGPQDVATPAQPAGNCLLSWNNWAHRSATTITSTSSAAGLGAERLKDPQVRRRLRTGPGAVTVSLPVDLGSVQEVGVLALLQPDDAGWIDEDGEAVGFLDPTADTIRHRLDAVTPGAGALYDSLYYRDATYTGATLDLNFTAQSYREYQNGIGSGVVHGYGLHAHILPAAVQARHWQPDIAFPSLATTPGYLDMGLLWIGPAFRPTRNFAYEWGDQWDDLSEVTEVRRSGLDFVDRGPKRRVLTFAFRALDEAEAKVAMAELGRIAGTSRQVLFIQEPDGPYMGRQAIIGRLVEVAPITQPNFALYERVFQIRQSL